MQLKDRTALITGASSGIGESIAVRFAAEGAKVALMALCEPEEIDGVKQGILATGGTAESFIGDVSDPVSVQQIVDATAAQFGSIDILVNNAGIAYMNLVGSAPLEDWDKMIAVNLNGPYYMINAAVPYMRKQGRGGAIVNISSIGSFWGLSKCSAYSASKGGLNAMAKALVHELSPDKIRINTIAPGAIHTPLNEAAYLAPGMEHSLRKLRAPSHRVFIEPEEVAAAAVFLASDQSSAITGELLVVDDGYSAVMPDVLSLDEDQEIIVPVKRYGDKAGQYDLKR